MTLRHGFRIPCVAVLWTSLSILLANAAVSGESSKTEQQVADDGTPSAKTEPEATSLRFVTYNVLGDPEKAEERTPALLRILRDADADVIALQETAPWFLARLRDAAWTDDYAFSVDENDRYAPSGLLLLSRLPMEDRTFRILRSRQGRGVLLVRLRAADRTVAVATVHLESPLADGPRRAAQLRVAFDMLHAAEADDAVLLGDLNFGDGEEPETSAVPDGWTDAWRAVHPDAPGLTWNIEESGMARKGSFPGEQSRRLDRILFRSDAWRVADAVILGDTPIDGERRELFPSDHFGLAAAFVVSPEPTRAPAADAPANAAPAE